MNDNVLTLFQGKASVVPIRFHDETNSSYINPSGYNARLLIGTHHKEWYDPDAKGVLVNSTSFSIDGDYFVFSLGANETQKLKVGTTYWMRVSIDNGADVPTRTDLLPVITKH